MANWIQTQVLNIRNLMHNHLSYLLKCHKQKEGAQQLDASTGVITGNEADGEGEQCKCNDDGMGVSLFPAEFGAWLKERKQSRQGKSLQAY